MNSARALLLAMILTQALATALLTDTRLFPAVCALAAVAVAARPPSRSLAPRLQWRVYIAVMVFFAVKMRLAPLDIPDRFSPFPNSYDLNHAFAQALLTLQVLALAFNPIALQRSARALSARHILPFFGMVQLACITDFVSRAPVHRWTALGGAAAFAAFFALYSMLGGARAAQHRRGMGRGVICAIIMLFASLLGIAVARLSVMYASQIELLMFSYLQPPARIGAVGASERATLNSVSEMRANNANQAALRIRAKAPPGYLRGKVYDRFDGKVWYFRGDERPLAQTALPESKGGLPETGRAYALRAQATTPDEAMEVWPTQGLHKTVYAALDTAVIGADAPTLTADGHQACRAEELPLSLPYCLYGGAQPGEDAPADDLRNHCLAVPESLSEEARQTALAVLGHAETAQEKIDAVVRFFAAHFQYRLGISIPADQDALSYFICDRPPAHCEFFAAGAAMILRLGGVPCRYVAGFLVAEWNPAGGYWTARNRDAHAWVEAWDDDRGWVLVEATPGGGLPETDPLSPIAAHLDALRFRLGWIWALLREQGLAGPQAWLRLAAAWIVRTWFGRVLIGLLCLGGAAWCARRLRGRFIRVRISPEEMRCRRVLARMDRIARRQGFTRPLHETLHQFAARIAAVEEAGPWHAGLAQWYEDYASLRCRGGLRDDALRLLESKALAASRRRGRSRPDSRRDA